MEHRSAPDCYAWRYRRPSLPWALRRRRWSELRERRRQTIFLLPGLLTTGNLLCGFYAITLTFDGRHQWAALALFIGMVLDMLDGQVARLTRTTTQFGVEFDSLADVVSFGVAPALLLYSWALQPLGRVGAGAAFLYVICGALRLARFNVLTGVARKDSYRELLVAPVSMRSGIESLITEDMRFRDPRQAEAAYAEGWALTYFLITKRQAAYVAYMKALAENGPPTVNTDPNARLQQYRAAFGNDLGKLDAEFLRFIDTIK
jgi:CDP-diacylglycerol--serine O-phosphatidyltransferase